MKNFFKHNFIYLITYLVLLVYLGFVLLSDGKVQIHQQINTCVGNAFFDTFFKYMTYVGDGIFVVGVGLVILYFNLKKGIYILSSYITASVLTTILKTFVFIKIWRPTFVFEYFVHYDLKIVSGVDLHIGNSFPSGHSTAAFAFFMSLIFTTNNQFLKCCFFILALLASFSRTYLSQHWLVDIYFGSMIGTAFAILMYFVFYKKQSIQKLDGSFQQYLARKK